MNWEFILAPCLSRLRKLHQVIAPKEGFEAQLRAARVPITFGMRALGMTRQRHDGRLYRVIEPGHVPGLPGLDNPASDVYSTQSHLARGPGHRQEEWGHRSQKPFARRGGNGGPPPPLDDRGICGVKGVQRRVGLPFLQQ